MSGAILEAKQNVRYCKECCTLTDKELCPICSSDRRDHETIMVVENTRDLAAYEKTGKYNGVYHVLHGAISPMLGIGPGDIRLKELMTRLQKEEVREVIIATNSSLEGEKTAMYLSKLIKPTGIRVTRIASGVPVGGDLEYIDEVTLLRALDGLGFSSILIVFSIFPGLPDLLAELAGTYTTANFIYLSVIFLLIVKMFHMSIKQSQLETKIKDLAQKIALDENERGKEAQTSVKKVVSQKNE